jgi:polysaccharide transporter, PST family
MLKQILINGGFKIGTQIISLLSTIFIARILGASVIGEYNFAISLIVIFKVFIINSLASTNIYFINKNENDSITSQNTLVFVSYILFIVYAILLTIYAYFNFYDQNINLFYVIISLLVAELIGLKFITSRSYYNANLNQYKAAFPEFIRTLLTKTFQIITVFAFKDILGLALSVFLATIFLLPILVRSYSPILSFKFPTTFFLSNYLKKSLHFSTNTLTKLVPQQLDKIILETCVSFTFIGYYTIGQKIGNTIEMLTMSIGIVLFPFFTKLSQNLDTKKTIIIASNLMNISFNIIFFFLFVTSFFAADILVFVFGDEYILSIFSMNIYILIGIVSILLMPFNNIGLGFGELKKISRINIISFIGFIFLALYISQMDIEEIYIINLMSIIRLISYLFLSVFFITYCNKLLSFNFTKNLILLCVHILLFILFNYLIIIIKLNLVLLLLFYTFSYYLLNILFGESPMITYRIIKMRLKK